ncbi:DUF4382 domain-containing protein [Chitinophaga defluvii]|uniref:DUF4382 domain-containing protein n=1 Tax=Chitinophaga defluvii TaxID=3163343 RepID=A0ABV2TDB6_9BACT
MKPTMKHVLPGLFVLAGALFFSSCTNDDTNSMIGKSRLQVALTDDPGDFRAVYIDVQDVNISYTEDDDNGWLPLPGIKKGMYNLLTLVNDKDTVLADATINSGTIKEIRLVLGDNNWVVTNRGDSVKLQTPSGQSSGVKLKINMPVTDGILYKLLLDFDVAKSIHEAGNSGKYMLHPVIRTILAAQGGTIQGAVWPDSVKTAIIVLNGADTVASTYTGAGGAYTIKGVNAATYALHYLPTDTTYNAAIKDGITVNVGSVTTVDTLRLQKK